MTTPPSEEWPPKAGLSTPSVHRKDVILPISASIEINTPATTVWKVLLDTSTWGEWNTFVPRVKMKDSGSDGILRLDTRMVFDAVMDPKKPDKINETPLKVCDISTPEKPSTHVSEELLNGDHGFTKNLSKIYRIAWKSDGGYPGLRSERFHEVIITGKESCEVRTWELLGGLLARTVKMMYSKTLDERFQDWCRDLKERAESVWEKEKGNKS